jgi:exosortase
MDEDRRQPARERADRVINIMIVLAAAGILASIYGPLLLWLGRTTLTFEQLHNGGLIVLFALVISLRRAVREQRSSPEASNLGMALVAIGIGSLYLVKWVPAFSLPLALLSFCLSFAGVSSFLFGASGVRALLPAMAGIVLLGVLAGVAPSMDWPLRAVSAKYSASILDALGAKVNVALHPGRPPELLLIVRNRPFIVAAECNGFGLLTSSILVAAILGFHYRLSWIVKLTLFLLAVPLAVLFNTLRIVGICLAATHTRLPYTLIHEGIGLFFYVAALGLLWATARHCAAPEPEEDGAAAGPGDS